MQRAPRRWMLVLYLLMGALALPAGAVAPTLIQGPTIITVPGTYLLESNLSVPNGAPVIEVRVSDVTIEGNGRTVAGVDAPNSCGVLVHSTAGIVRNVTVRNLNIRDLQYGCYLWKTANTSLEDCRIVSCTFGITFNPAERGCVTACWLEENEFGIAISGGSIAPTIRSTRVTDSLRTGVYIYSTRGGEIVDNYLVNTRNVYVDDRATGISWSAGPRPGRSVAGGRVLGGNFWGRPTGRGFSQTMPDTNGDGICDRTYRVAGYMVDTLPLREGPNTTPPRASFKATPPSGTAPLTIRFTDTSLGDTGACEWSFGDGTSSIGRNATHRFSAPGRYRVTLTVRDPAGANLSANTSSVTVAAPIARPVASFRATPRVGDLPIAVQFTDTSSGLPRSWSWTFGDGTSSTERNPRHLYHDAGSYTVTLRVTNAAGNSTRTKTRLIVVTDPEEEKEY